MIKSCFGTKESKGNSRICQACKLKGKCRNSYLKSRNKFREMEDGRN
jgi:hypothetical protein